MPDPDDRISVLLVEDEVLLCWLLDEALSEGNYAVVTKTTGTAGLAELEAHHFDALVTNIRLTDGPDGWALAQRAREINPSMRVLYVTGDSAAQHKLEGVQNSLMLSKPFEPHELKDNLDRLLQS